METHDDSALLLQMEEMARELAAQGNMSEMEAADLIFFRVAAIALALAIADLPPSPGYEPWFLEHRIHPLVGRGFALLTVRRACRLAKENAVLSTVAAAIRFLARPHKKKSAVVARIRIVLNAAKETSAVETIFARVGLNEAEYIDCMKRALEEDEDAINRICEISQHLLPHLKVSRGRKSSESTLGHEWFLSFVRCLPQVSGGRSYTWNPHREKFTDSMTEATRREFGHRKFNPRGAHHRIATKRVSFPDLRPSGGIERNSTN